jgi:hypothetical protein
LADKLAPLPVADTSDKLVPFNESESVVKPADVSASAESNVDPVESWISDNPEFKESSDTTDAARAAREAVDSKIGNAPDDAAAATTDKPGEAAAPTTKAPVAADTIAPVADATATPVANTDAAPALVAPAAKSYDPSEKIALADGVEWTRGQVTKRLEQYVEQQPLVQEAEGFRKLFGTDFANTKQAWEPILTRLVAEPQTSRFLDEFLGNANLADYLERCRVNYYVETGSASPNGQPVATTPGPVAPAMAPNDPMARELREMREWRAQQEQREATDRTNREIGQATSRYPMLATNKELMGDLLLTAQYMNAQDPSKGILDALAAKASIYDALSIARTAPSVTETPAPVPAPALLGTGGASPTASRRPASERPKNFDNLDDAVDEFLANPPRL